MKLKLIGAVFMIFGCGRMGWKIAAAYRKEAHALDALCHAFSFMQCELRYRLTPLPYLCEATSAAITGPVSVFFSRLSSELKKQISPDVRCCVETVLSAEKLPQAAQVYLRLMGDTLGQFDLEGQLQGLAYLMDETTTALENHRKDQGNRLRSYQTLGLCAGAAMAILFL